MTTTHEKPTPAPVEVTQGDREAAQALMDRWEFSDLYRDDFAEAFARHRIAHSAPAGEVEPVAWMYSRAGDDLPPSVRTIRHEGGDFYLMQRNGWTETPLYPHPAPPADLVELVEALRELLHAYCSDTGFAAAVRQDTGLAYPWAPGEIAEARARAALAKHTRAQGEG